MNEKDQIELVNRHAEALNHGRGLGFELAERDPETRQLLIVAGRVKSILRPIAPPAGFVRDLKQRLVSEARQAQAQRNQQWLMLAAGLGGLIYGLGVLAVGYRTSIWMLGLVAVALGLKRRQQAQARVKPTP